MKQIFTLLTVCFFAFSGLNAQTVLFQDDFQTAGFPTGYTLYDVDGNTVNSQIAGVFPNAWNRLQFTSNQGAWFIASTSMYTPTGTANDWVITPKIQLDSNTTNFLYFDARNGSAAPYDSYEILVSTTDTLRSSFTSVFSVAAENPTWTTRAVNLTAFAGQEVYIAFRNNTYDGYIIAIDNIEVRSGESYPAVDAAMSKINVSSVFTPSSTVSIAGEIASFGTDTLDSLNINWRVDGGTVNTESFTGLGLGYGQNYSFTHNTTYTVPSNGAFELEVWVSNPNGQTDTIPQNDTLVKYFISPAGTDTAQRKVLFEEFTTSVCQYCPDGHLYMENILAQNANVIPVSIHSCFNTDAMTNQEALDLCDAVGSNSAPSGMVDRIVHQGDQVPAHGRGTNINTNNVWRTRVNARSQVGSPVSLDVSGTYNAATRGVTLDVDVEYHDYTLPANLSLMIIEDSLSGVGAGWAQYNAYYAVTGHPMYGIGTPFPSPNQNISYINNYMHRHVLRDILPSTFGDADVLPKSPVLNSVYSHTFNYTVPANYKINDVSFVVVVNYEGETPDDFEVLNAEEVTLQDVITSLNKKALNGSNATFEVYPNPSQSITNLELTLAETLPLEVSVFDITGKEVINRTYSELVKGTHTLPINVSALPNGFYIMKVKAGNEVMSKKISVNR